MTQNHSKVYFSYHHLDFHLAESLACLLASQGLTVPSVSDTSAIQNSMRLEPKDSIWVVVLLRPEYLVTDYTLRELNHLEQHGVSIILILTDPISPKTWFESGIDLNAHTRLDLTALQLDDPYFENTLKSLCRLVSASDVGTIPDIVLKSVMRNLDKLHIFSKYELALLTLGHSELSQRPTPIVSYALSRMFDFNITDETVTSLASHNQDVSGIEDILSSIPRLGIIHDDTLEHELILDIVCQHMLSQHKTSQIRRFPIRIRANQINYEFFQEVRKVNCDEITLLIDEIDNLKDKIINLIVMWLGESPTHRLVTITAQRLPELSKLLITYARPILKTEYRDTLSITGISVSILYNIYLNTISPKESHNICSFLGNVTDILHQYSSPQITHAEMQALRAQLSDFAYHMLVGTESSKIPQLSTRYSKFSVDAAVLAETRTRFSDHSFLSYYAALSKHYQAILDILPSPTFISHGQRKRTKYDLSVKIHIHCLPNFQVAEFIIKLAEIDPFLALEQLIMDESRIHNLYKDILIKCTTMLGGNLTGHLWIAQLLMRTDKETSLQIIVETLKAGTEAQRNAAIQLFQANNEDLLWGLLESIDLELSDIELQQIVALLRNMHPYILPVLIQGTNSSNQLIRLRAIQLLGQLKIKEAIPELIRFMQESDPEISMMSIEAVRQFHNEDQVIQALMQRIAQGSWEVRKLATIVLLEVGGQNSFETLLANYQTLHEETKRIVQYIAHDKIDDRQTANMRFNLANPLLTRNNLSRWYRNRMNPISKVKYEERIQSSQIVKQRLNDTKQSSSSSSVELSSVVRSVPNAVEGISERLAACKTVQERIEIIYAMQVMEETDGITSILTGLLNDTELEVVDAAAHVLKLVAKAPCPELSHLLISTSDANLRAAIIDIIQSISDETASEALSTCLADQRRLWLSDETVAMKAEMALQSLHLPGMLHKQSQKPVLEVHRYYNQNFNKVDHKFNSILDGLQHNEWGNKAEASKALQSMAKLGEISNLLQHTSEILEYLDHTDWNVRYAAIEVIAWMREESAENKLIALLADHNWKIRTAAVRTLAELNSDVAIPAIAALLDDELTTVREAAAEALGAIGGEQVVQPLIKATLDREDFVRLAALEALGKINRKETIESLLLALNDQNSHVRWAAANAILIVDTGDISAELAQHLYDFDGPYWEQKRICDVIAEKLERIGSEVANSVLIKWQNALAGID